MAKKSATDGKKIAGKPARMRSDEYVDALINSPFDGLRGWTFNYDDSGGSGAPTEEFVDNVVGVASKAGQLVAFIKEYGRRAGLRDDFGPLTALAIRKIVRHMAKRRDCE